MMPYNPSGLFPSGRPPRPTYREPHPVGGASVAAGAIGTIAWLGLFGLLGRSLAGYAWWTLLAAGLAWLAALVLARYGDRGAAAGIAIVTAGGLSIVTAAVVTRWVTSGDWPLW
ncbi:hypothetical protein SAMN05443287_113119 [Micromonospora phaseoli]|uniref:Uncharacterized protein n=1 Tax=Micromonospora phaseoli TaxID=1144548 RepID=A0A1H7DLS5_9ACTN|nr:hypothetical protein [Micromonospora phaseoli]PZV90481.1 hypothetical protein CLV64_11317 [Micromonospora phaseoli]GIJ78127.1 hypothetical protein Xph01_25590 [Micromonospora phaseoli]SEK00220.1 hypothetical protein SAMN05443287_113119 [Micromonospora phaseoli]